MPTMAEQLNAFRGKPTMAEQLAQVKGPQEPVRAPVAARPRMPGPTDPMRHQYPSSQLPLGPHDPHQKLKSKYLTGGPINRWQMTTKDLAAPSRYLSEEIVQPAMQDFGEQFPHMPPPAHVRPEGYELNEAEQRWENLPGYAKLPAQALYGAGQFAGGVGGFVAGLPQMILDPEEGQLEEEAKGLGQMFLNVPAQAYHAATLGQGQVPDWLAQTPAFLSGKTPEEYRGDAMTSLYQSGMTEPAFAGLIGTGGVKGARRLAGVKGKPGVVEPHLREPMDAGRAELDYILDPKAQKDIAGRARRDVTRDPQTGELLHEPTGPAGPPLRKAPPGSMAADLAKVRSGVTTRAQELEGYRGTKEAVNEALRRRQARPGVIVEKVPAEKQRGTVKLEEYKASDKLEGSPEAMAEQLGVKFEGFHKEMKAYEFKDDLAYGGGNFAVRKLSDAPGRLKEMRQQFVEGKQKKGVTDAQSLREDAGRVPEAGVVPEGRRGKGGEDLQRQPEAGPEAGRVPQKEVTTEGINEKLRRRISRSGGAALAGAATVGLLSDDEAKPYVTAMAGMGLIATGGKAPKLRRGKPFYSKLLKTVKEKFTGKAVDAGSVRNALRKAGVKESEIKWAGLDEYLAGKKKVSTEDLNRFLEENQVEVLEIEKGPLRVPKKITELPEGYELGHDPSRPLEQKWHILPPGQTHARPFSGRHATKQAATAEAIERINREAAERAKQESTTKFEQWQLPGGESYRELLLTMPRKPVLSDAAVREFHNIDKHRWKRYTEKAQEDLRAEAAHELGYEAGKPLPKTEFTGGHFDEPNVLASVRFNTRKGPKGEKILFIEEIQSDWHQKGREKGYAQPLRDSWEVRDKNGDLLGSKWTEAEAKDVQANIRSQGVETTITVVRNDPLSARGVPDAPFKKTWHELALKRMLHYAAEKGYDKVAWTKGGQQAARYDLSKHVSEVMYNESRKSLHAYDHSGKAVIVESNVEPSQLVDYIGKEPAERLLAQPYEKIEVRGAEGQKIRRLKGEDLKVGGEGMAGFYDKILPRFMNKYAKKWGAKTGGIKINVEPHFGEAKTIDLTRKDWGESVHSIDITPSMRGEVTTKGQTLFGVGGALAGGATAAYLASKDKDKAALAMTLPFLGRKGKRAVKSKALATADAITLKHEAAVRQTMTRPIKPTAKTPEVIAFREKGMSLEEAKRTVAKDVAEKAGVAMRVTRGGKLVPSIRKTGVYVPEDFATYKNFKEPPVHSLQLTDPTRLMQEIDGALPLEKKAKLPGQAGPVEKYVLWRTRDYLTARTKWVAAQAQHLKEIAKDLSKKDRKTVNKINEVMTTRKMAYVDPAKLAASGPISRITRDIKVITAAQNIRKMYEHLLVEQNKFRRLRSMDEIPHREGYSPDRIKKQALWAEALGVGKSPIDIMQKPAPPDYIRPNAPFVSHTLAREANLPQFLREMDAVTLMEHYINAAAKDMYNTSIVQNNKAFAQQLHAMGRSNAARAIEDWTAEAFAGVRAQWDKAANPPPLARRMMKRFRQAFNLTMYPLNWRWVLGVQWTSAALVPTRCPLKYCGRGMWDWFVNRKQRALVKENAHSYGMKALMSGRMSQQDIGTIGSGRARVKRTMLETATDASTYLIEQMEQNLTGWAVATGYRHGKAKGLTGDALWQYASDVGAKSQSMYNYEWVPGILRSEVVKTVAPAQTFKFEMYNTMREWAGKTGTPPATARARIGWALRFTAGVLAANQVAGLATNRKPWGPGAFVPFYDMIFGPAIAAFRTGGSEFESRRGLSAPLGIATEYGKAMHEWVTKGNKKYIRKWSNRYLPGMLKIPGGTQISKTIEGMIANANEGVYDIRGREIFPITEPSEKLRSFMGGPYFTRAGQEYIQRRDKGWIDLVKPAETEKKPTTRKRRRQQRPTRPTRPGN